MLRAALPQTPEERHPGPAQYQQFQQLRNLPSRHDLPRQLFLVSHSQIAMPRPEHMNPKSTDLIVLHRFRVDAACLWFFLESYKMKIERKRWTNSCSSSHTRSPREHWRKRVAAVAARRDMNRPERFIAPLRPCERTCASQAVLVPSFSLPLSLPFSHRQPGFRFRFRTGSHAKSVKIIFTRFAARICDNEIGISNRLRSETERSKGSENVGREILKEKKAEKDSEAIKSKFRKSENKNRI